MVNSNSLEQRNLEKLSVFIKEGNYNEAKKIALTLTRDYPKNSLGWKALGIIYDNVGKIDDAIKVKRKSVELSPFDYEAHCNLGNSYKNKKNFKEAEESYRNAIEINHEFSKAYFNLGNLFFETFRFDEAENFFKRFILLDPKNDEGFRALGVLYHKLSRFEEAEKNFKSAIDLQPKNARTYVDLGNLLKENSYHGCDVENAIICYKTAIKINPDINCKINFAAAYLQNLKPKEALSLINSELNQNSKNITAYAYKYIALRGIEKYSEANNLINFSNFVREIDSKEFLGKNFKKFNRDLKNDIINHPEFTHKEDLQGWTIRGESVIENLFSSSTSSIIEFKELLKECLKKYISDLPNINNHPFIVNKTKKCELNSCWVNFLGPGDYQSNHIHMNGSITGVYYLDEPEIEVDNKNAGWIEFNRAGSNLPHFGEEKGLELIKPLAGMFIFFPSYIWHGTIPHKNPYTRISISFDFIFS